MERVVETEIVWHEVASWNPKFIYPLPVGYMERNQKEYIVEGWQIYKQDPQMKEDIVPVGNFKPMTFSQALEICEGFNNERLVHDRTD